MSPVYVIKLVLFGNQAVGKTSLIERYINNKFENEYISTLGYNVYQRELDFVENSIKFTIFDVGAQEQFRDIRKKYAAGAHAALLVYDVTNKESFQNIINWHKDLMEFTHDSRFIIVGNKIDLVDQRQVTKEEGEKIALDLSADGFFETSAKDNIQIEEAFYQFAKLIIEKINAGKVSL